MYKKSIYAGLIWAEFIILQGINVLLRQKLPGQVTNM